MGKKDASKTNVESRTAKSNGSEAKPQAPGAVAVQQVTATGILQGFLTSPKTLIIFAPLGMMIFQTEEGEKFKVVVVACLIIGVLIAAFLTSKLENSEWRQNLRREAAKREAAMGISHADKVKAAYEMGLTPPPAVDLPKEPAREKKKS
eukprot:CAMPEP_0115248358 /NCGR_PEP_ID=MMETSP0270-20121206/42030_1 /TAXON_ID=71861 /ORGANISM="Scrippsiella trochoidea, Strain CCMP3099" /LENGTH=148 /DNA_ID=CAMNT_0002663659 /DNA_START=10 /DNA_END=456 /DNA_ORIENTATION=+